MTVQPDPCARFVSSLHCGHQARTRGRPRPGQWVTCPDGRCQGQRRVDAVAVARPRLLDLFCGAGGAGMGYHRAGFDVTGVDIESQPRYPFEFRQADAMTFPLDGFDVIHASPPCQDYSRAMRHLTAGYPRLIDPVRARLSAAGVPWVIENVPGAPLPHQTDLFGAHGVELCGTMFGLPIWRHRLFEASLPLSPPRGCDHSAQPLNPHRAVRPGGRTIEADYREAMGVGWMGRHEAREAIPPAYAEHIGRELLEHLAAGRVA